MRGLSGTHLLVGLTSTVVIIAVVGGFIVVGPPSDNRARQLDAKRVADLRRIAGEVDLYLTRHERLPSTLEDLSQGSWAYLNARDPGSAETYDYRVLDEATYELCAHFERESEEPVRGVSGNVWSHGAGRQCFELEAQ